MSAAVAAGTTGVRAEQGRPVSVCVCMCVCACACVCVCVSVCVRRGETTEDTSTIATGRADEGQWEWEWEKSESGSLSGRERRANKLYDLHHGGRDLRFYICTSKSTTCTMFGQPRARASSPYGTVGCQSAQGWLVLYCTLPLVEPTRKSQKRPLK